MVEFVVVVRVIDDTRLFRPGCRGTAAVKIDGVSKTQLFGNVRLFADGCTIDFAVGETSVNDNIVNIAFVVVIVQI